jgi:hypothetical protein
MFRHTGGELTKHGFYWNPRTWQVTLIERQGGVLPGQATERYARVPVLGMLFLAPIMGAAYVMFLPVIGFAMVLDFLGRRAFRAAKSGTVAMASVVSPRWRPGEAYLAKEEKDKDEKTEKGDEDGKKDGE